MMMSNQKRLEEYLVGNKEQKEIGYLKSDISNGKVIMLSGKWGSGKTHFWKNKIQTVLNDENKRIPNHYISLYGKTSIQEIKNEMFLKIFESVDSYEVIEKSKNFAKNTVNLASSFFGAISILGVNLDISKVSDKQFENLEKMLDDKKLKKTEEYLNSGAIICFDDFERKSKEIDLNDLFGFITQLTLNFDCKVVIILNDDVFEGEEKKIFSNVKEKSVSKFLKYAPKIKELFETIFSDDRYRTLDNHKEIILKTIEETEELNARIYIQVLDNLVEWIDRNQEINDDVLKCLILVNVNFILFHTILYRYFYQNTGKHGLNIEKFRIKNYDFDKNSVFFQLHKIKSFLEFKEKLVQESSRNNKDYSDEKNRIEMKFIEDNILLFKSVYFTNKLDILKNVDDKTFQKINNFIETGILINE
jgi:hypothetical protein